MTRLLEICVGSLNSVQAACDGGADRIELCDNLCEGGTTPSYGMVRTALTIAAIPVFPIIRPRGGNFVYSDEEFEAMKQDIICFLDLGCRGIVTGILLDDGQVDKARCRELVKLAGSMEVTFHRAFDRCSEMTTAMEDIIDLGFSRILTSGGKQSAAEATNTLRDLVDQASDRIVVMPGAGLNTGNLRQVSLETGASEFHSTAKLPLTYNNPDFDSQASGIYETDSRMVTKMKKILNNQPAK